MKNSILFLLTMIVFVFQSNLLGQSVKAEVKSIDAYCKSLDAVGKKRKTPELVFADVSGLTDKTEKWRSFASEKALDKYREDSETYSIAYNWRKNGKIVVSNFTFFSGSGDWVKYVYHYFREDGTLARVESELRTFNGDYIVNRRRHFDRSGKLISKTEKYLDLTTKKPKKPEGGGVMGDNPKKIDYYKTTGKLPFAHLLKKK
ncbi:MAG: hypothetical protein IPL32_11740 [Chloracidobacterium sp.]|nr:hypothetical protein [Chloracidobacterium sp.]